MANLDLQEISSGASLDDTTLNNNINLLNTVPLTGTTLNNIPTFSEDEKITAADINEAFTAIKDNWIDTSDATATENDMALGTTAYVNGEKVTGNVSVRGEGESSGYPNGTVMTSLGDAWAGKAIAMYTIDKGQILYRKGVTIGIGVPFADFGDAQPSDVAVGKTFTSSAGLKQPGTANLSTNFNPNNYSKKTFTSGSLASWAAPDNYYSMCVQVPASSLGNYNIYGYELHLVISHDSGNCLYTHIVYLNPTLNDNEALIIGGEHRIDSTSLASDNNLIGSISDYFQDISNVAYKITSNYFQIPVGYWIGTSSHRYDYQEYSLEDFRLIVYYK